jgi:hypothetical protein
MAIETTQLNGTDSVAAGRITINDNFATIKDALNRVLSVFDIATGKINNYGFGSDNDIETEDLIVRGSTGGGISVLSGGISISLGNLTIGGAGYIEFGSGSSVKIEKLTKLFNISPGNIPVWNVSGTGATGGTGPIGYFGLPRLDTATINDIKFPQVGALVYDVSVGTTGALKCCVESGVTGTWQTVTLT